MAKVGMPKTKPQRTRNKFLREHREDLQVQAKVRQGLYDKLSVPQKLAKLDAGGYVAAKQRARLTYSEAAKAASTAMDAGKFEQVAPIAKFNEPKKTKKSKKVEA